MNSSDWVRMLLLSVAVTVYLAGWSGFAVDRSKHAERSEQRERFEFRERPAAGRSAGVAADR